MEELDFPTDNEKLTKIPENTSMKSVEERYSEKLYTDVHSSSVHDSREVEKTQMSIMDDVVYPYSGILFSHNKE